MRLNLVDADTGEAYEAFAAGDTARHRARQKIRAFVRYLMEERGGGYVYVLGTPWHKDRLNDMNKALVELGRMLRTNWIQVLEVGKAGYMHVHMIMEHRYELDEYEDDKGNKLSGLRWRWQVITGVENPHVKRQRLYGGEEGAAKTANYLSKYCAKEERWHGSRVLRSSKNLTRIIEKYFEKSKGYSTFMAKLPQYAESDEFGD